ncbi:MAG: hypothetical protein U1A78_00920 [Polyangia bacterium]
MHEPDATQALSESELLLHAESLLRSGEAVAALRLCDTLLGRFVESPGGYFVRAQAQRALERPWHGLCDVRAALALARRRGMDLQSLLALAEALEAQVAADPLGRPRLGARHHTLEVLGALLIAGHGAAVEEIAESLLPRFGDAPLLWFAIGLARRTRGRIDRALSAIEQALIERPTLPAAIYLRGRCMLDRGDVESALATWARLDELPEPVWPPPESTWIEDGAIHLLQRLPEYAWDERELYFQRARLYADAGLAGAAAATLDHLLAREPSAVDALLAKARLLLRQHRGVEALAVFESAAQALQPLDRLLEDPDPLVSIELGRARAHTLLGDEAAARAALVRARAIQPGAALEDAALDAQLRAGLAPLGPEASRRADLRGRLRAALRAAVPQPSREATTSLLELATAALRTVDAEPEARPAPAAECEAALVATRPLLATLRETGTAARVIWAHSLVEVAALIVQSVTPPPAAPSG